MSTAIATTGVVCRDLVKDYGQGESRIRALRGITVDIHPGELTLLVGPSGCGKTTLISILAATLDATSGTVDVLGSRLNALTKDERSDFRARNVGFVFQQFNLLPAFTAAENVAVPLMIQGMPRDQAIARAEIELRTVGLEDRLHAFPAKLSGGQQQRVAIARALVHEPHLLVCDEPTSAIDAKTGHLVMTLIRQLARSPERVTVVVTHDARVFGFGDRMITLEDGRVARDERVQAPVSNPE
ncbi:MAG TPA: ABC transporter ATP-binding protein [Pirellulales bacterium]|nr:ABC transporter ATP-binding protein [Pirellulales bacterium]